MYMIEKIFMFEMKINLFQKYFSFKCSRKKNWVSDFFFYFLNEKELVAYQAAYE